MRIDQKGAQPKALALVSPDVATTKYVAHRLSKVDIFPQIVTTGKKELQKTIASDIVEISTLLLVPSLSLSTDQLQLVEKVRENGGLVLAWSAADSSPENNPFDDWLLERLLEQLGAKTSPRISVLSEAASFSHRGLRPQKGHLNFTGRKSAITGRISRAFGREGFTLDNRKKNAISLRLSEEGRLLLAEGPSSVVELTDPWISAEAFGLLCQDSNQDSIPEFILPSPEQELAESIARPPPRLLSETTSKRLASYFGIPLPEEKLCQSATEATRFAATLDAPVVIKLVRPAFEKKSESNGVYTNISGPAAVRRAVHGLEVLGKRLSPPKAIGVLVAEQLSYEIALWVKMLDHQTFGRVALAGFGESPSDTPQIALRAQSSYEQIYRALAKMDSAVSAQDCGRLAATLASFCQMIHVLGQRIYRAEIHPLVTLEGHHEALALDVLIGIGNPEEMHDHR